MKTVDMTLDELAEQPRPFTAKAWDMIGWDDGKFRILGGRAVYEAVMYNCHNEGRLVKIARLEAVTEGIREVSRYVDPDTVLEFLPDTP